VDEFILVTDIETVFEDSLFSLIILQPLSPFTMVLRIQRRAPAALLLLFVVYHAGSASGGCLALEDSVLVPHNPLSQHSIIDNTISDQKTRRL
jgi:hypothetical protein